jgi:hypothetical protein
MDGCPWDLYREFTGGIKFFTNLNQASTGFFGTATPDAKSKLHIEQQSRKCSVLRVIIFIT